MRVRQFPAGQKYVQGKTGLYPLQKREEPGVTDALIDGVDYPILRAGNGHLLSYIQRCIP